MEPPWLILADNTSGMPRRKDFQCHWRGFGYSLVTDEVWRSWPFQGVSFQERLFQVRNLISLLLVLFPNSWKRNSKKKWMQAWWRESTWQERWTLSACMSSTCLLPQSTKHPLLSARWCWSKNNPEIQALGLSQDPLGSTGWAQAFPCWGNGILWLLQEQH